jgi:hypothetical protein
MPPHSGGREVPSILTIRRIVLPDTFGPATRACFRIDSRGQLLYRSIPLAGAVGFVARGPILATDDLALAAAAAEGLERLAASCNVIFFEAAWDTVAPPEFGARTTRWTGRANAPHAVEHGDPAKVVQISS